MRRSVPALALAIALLAATPGASAVVGALGDATAGPAAVDSGAQSADGSNETVAVEHGSQLSTVLAATEADVGANVSRTVLDSRLAEGNETERAAALADRADAVRLEADAIAAEYENATAAYRNGTLNRSAYAQRLAALNARARSVESRAEQVRERAGNVSGEALAAADYDSGDVATAEESVDAVAGAGPAALRERFTGRSNGTVSLRADDGLSVEVANGNGERSREVRRAADGNDSLAVPQGEALSAARAALSDESESWGLRAAEVGTDGGYYRFEFGVQSPNETGVAEVRVDGSTGEVVGLEEEIGPREAGERSLSLSLAGAPRPNETASVVARYGGSPQPNVTVSVDGERAGTTGPNGRVAVTLTVPETEIDASYRDADAELSFEFDASRAGNATERGPPNASERGPPNAPERGPPNATERGPNAIERGSGNETRPGNSERGNGTEGPGGRDGGENGSERGENGSGAGADGSDGEDGRQNGGESGDGTQESGSDERETGSGDDGNGASDGGGSGSGDGSETEGDAGSESGGGENAGSGGLHSG